MSRSRLLSTLRATLAPSCSVFSSTALRDSLFCFRARINRLPGDIIYYTCCFFIFHTGLGLGASVSFWPEWGFGCLSTGGVVLVLLSLGAAKFVKIVDFEGQSTRKQLSVLFQAYGEAVNGAVNGMVKRTDYTICFSVDG